LPFTLTPSIASDETPGIGRCFLVKNRRVPVPAVCVLLVANWDGVEYTVRLRTFPAAVLAPGPEGAAAKWRPRVGGVAERDARPFCSIPRAVALHLPARLHPTSCSSRPRFLTHMTPSSFSGTPCAPPLALLLSSHTPVLTSHDARVTPAGIVFSPYRTRRR